MARRMAGGTPFVHHPGGASVIAFAAWGSLRPPTARGAPPRRADAAARFRDGHVFAYAGPACFVSDLGKVVLFFGRLAEAEGSPGAVCRFDSGALLEPRPMCLQPWAGARPPGTPGRRLDFARVDACSTRLTQWRERFEAWLLDSYDDPSRYLEDSGDRYRDGRPDRLVPEELLRENGRAGAADRRAWTWEARFGGELGVGSVLAVLVPDEQVAQAVRLFGPAVVRTFARGPNDPITTEMVYRRSIEIVKEFVR